ncbi:MAG: THUMP domain-containing class I SAM-dependent RNA methyltransferase [Saccharofermentanales bacterium]|nr:class I SAM-dependent RNA methyltransferase [Bacillota bacterium]NLB09147.1 class I SAM-dependent RNA methyltransferase [Clostridiales bacterium]
MSDRIDSGKQIILPVLFGIEAATVRELEKLELPAGDISVTDGQVSFRPEDESKIPNLTARFNYNCRTAERVLIGLSSFRATDFDQLYDYARQLPWEEWLDRDFALTVTGYSLKSQLFGVSAMQSVIKKAIVDRLVQIRKLSPGSRITENKSKGELVIRFAAVKDKITIMLDSSGEGLHKRGYRPLTHMAPIRETLAAAILDYMHYQKNQQQGEILLDPVCGSGTFLIEAALISAGKAPGLLRNFAGQKMGLIGSEIFREEAEFARARELPLPNRKICFGSDISRQSVHNARLNAERAGVAQAIDFKTADLRELRNESIEARAGADRILVIANPPYGERLATPGDSAAINCALGGLVLEKNTGMNKKGWRLGIITADRNLEKQLGFRADKRRKLYNGMIMCQLFQYFKTGPRPKIKAGKGNYIRGISSS